MIKRLLFTTALLLAPLLASAALPPPYTATYEVRRNGEPLGTATVVFRSLANGRFELTSSTVGSEGLAALAGVSVDERSIIRVANGAPETVAYSYRQKLAWKTRSRGLQVDAAAARITLTDKDREYSPPYRAGVLDRNAITVALMGDLAAGKTGRLEYFVPSRDELETHVYQASPVERLSTALGAQKVVRVERIRESAGGRTTTLWLGQDQHYVPLRMLQTEPDGETIEMRIRTVR
jgi:hypothetical protein